MSLERVYDLAFEVLPDGGIELEQGAMEVNRVSLHACHVRLLLERAGHLLPPPPADELTRRLAWQLCSVLLELCNESGLSPTVDRVIDTLIAYKDSIPGDVFPHGLYEKGEKPPVIERPEFELIQPTTKEAKQ